MKSLRSLLKKLGSIPLWAIIGVNFALKLFMFLYIAPWQPLAQEKSLFSWKDALQYEQLSESLLQKHQFTVPEDTLKAEHLSELQQTWLLYDQSGTLRVPTFPLFAAFVYYFTGIKPYVVIFLQILYSLLSIFFVYHICMLAFGNRSIAALSSLVYSVEIQSAYCCNMFSPDTMLVVMFLAATYFFIKALKSEKTFDILLSAFFLGLACLTKPIPIMYPVIILALLIFMFKTSWSKKLRAMAIYFSVFFLVIGVWSYRNYRDYGHMSLTTQYGYNLLTLNLTYSVAKHAHLNSDTVKVHFKKEVNKQGFLQTTNPFERSKIYEKVAYKVMQKHRLDYFIDNIEGVAGLYFSLNYMGMAKTFGWADNPSVERTFGLSTSVSELKKNMSANIKQTILGLLILLQLLIEYSLSLFGIFILWRERQLRSLILILLPICYFTMLTGNVPLGPYRFKLPITPFLCVLAGYGLYYIAERNKSGDSSSALV